MRLLASEVSIFLEFWWLAIHLNVLSIWKDRRNQRQLNSMLFSGQVEDIICFRRFLMGKKTKSRFIPMAFRMKLVVE